MVGGRSRAGLLEYLFLLCEKNESGGVGGGPGVPPWRILGGQGGGGTAPWRITLGGEDDACVVCACCVFVHACVRARASCARARARACAHETPRAPQCFLWGEESPNVEKNVGVPMGIL